MSMAMNTDAVRAARSGDATRLEARVAARTEELSSLSTHLLRMMESERSQLAKELHDELGGLITAAKMDMAWLQAHIGASLDAASEEKFRSVVQMLNQAMMLKRRVVESLRPSLLDHFGLSVALRSHFEEHCGARRRRVRRHACPRRCLDLEPAVQLTLFRVAQEALANLLARGGANTWSWCSSREGEGYLMTGRRRRRRRWTRSQQRTLVGMRHRAAGRRWQARSRGGAGPGQSDQGFRPAIPSRIGMS